VLFSFLFLPVEVDEDDPVEIAVPPQEDSVEPQEVAPTPDYREKYFDLITRKPVIGAEFPAPLK
jgi:hypothetical protein